MESVNENKMGVMDVRKLLVSMSVPMMLSMLVQALYNIVDSMFVSYIEIPGVANAGEKALAALGLAFPAQNLMIAVATGTGVGVNALLSKSLGEKNFERANKTALNAVFLALLSYAVFALGGGFFSRAFFDLQTHEEIIASYGADYLFICTVFSFGLFGQVVFEKLLQSTGRTFYTMLIQGTGAVANIILDPLFIFTFNMGVAGAALATVIGQILAACLGLVLNLRKNDELRLTFKRFRPDGFIIKRIYAVGAPSILMASIGSVMTVGMNQILTAFTSTAVAVFNVYFKLQSFVFMPVFGLNNGMVPIVAYNYGARRPERISGTIRWSVVIAVSIMLVGLAAFEFFPGLLLGIFNASPDMLLIGKTALRIIGTHFLLAGFDIICSSVFQALGHGVLSLITAVMRQLVVLLPAAWLLSRAGGLSAVWWAFPVAELASLICCVIFLRRLYQREIRPMMNASEPACEAAGDGV